jgi:formylglycine-generating enzyme required for sulfatase activity
MKLKCLQSLEHTAIRCLLGGCLLWGTPMGYGAETQTPPPDGKFTNYVQKMPGSTVTFAMVAIPGGTISLGAPTEEPGRDTNDLPRRIVTVKPFWMGRCEVAWEEYLPFVFYDSSEILRNEHKLEGKIDRDGISHPTPPYGSVYRGLGEKGHPALGMGLPAAYEFCRWVTKRTGVHYRLPTEEEWEYACRAGSTNAYFWGANAALAKDYGWFVDNASETTQIVGKLKSNGFGLFDLAGNVAEWCFDPQKPAVFVARGGAFTEPVTRLRSATRMIETQEWNELDPQFPQSIWWLASADWVGFRLVRSFDEKAGTTNDPAVTFMFPQPSAPAKPVAVRVNYLKYCVVCHGLTGKGDTGTGKRLRARDYSDPQVKASLKDDAMFKAIKDGLIIDGYNVMSSFAPHLSSDEMKALVDYLKKF